MNRVAIIAGARTPFVKAGKAFAKLAQRKLGYCFAGARNALHHHAAEYKRHGNGYKLCDRYR